MTIVFFETLIFCDSSPWTQVLRTPEYTPICTQDDFITPPPPFIPDTSFIYLFLPSRRLSFKILFKIGFHLFKSSLILLFGQTFRPVFFDLIEK